MGGRTLRGKALAAVLQLILVGERRSGRPGRSITLVLGAFEGVPGMRRPDVLAVGKDEKTIDIILKWPDDELPHSVDTKRHP
jgi:hypothetical protein